MRACDPTWTPTELAGGIAFPGLPIQHSTDGGGREGGRKREREGERGERDEEGGSEGGRNGGREERKRRRERVRKEQHYQSSSNGGSYHKWVTQN